MNSRKHTKDFVYIVLAFVLLGSVLIFFEHLCSPQGFIYIMICSFIIVIGFSYLINLLLMLFTSKDKTEYILPISCGIIFLISLISGFIIFANDNSFMLNGLSGELIWVFISVPSFICSFVYGVLLIVHLKKIHND